MKTRCPIVALTANQLCSPRKHVSTVNATIAVLGALVLQQALFALLWGVLARLRLSRRAAVHWCAGTGTVTLGMALVVLRSEVSRWLGFWLACVLLCAGFVAIRRGVELFARVPVNDRAHAATLASYALILAPLVTWAPYSWYVLFGTLPLGALMWLSGRTVIRHLSPEFGARAARFCGVPMCFIGAVLIVRGLLGLVVPASTGGSMHAPGATNVASGLLFVVCGLVLNMALCGMVATRLLRSLQRAGERDGLTGLLNRRAVELRLAERWSSLAAGGAPFCVLSIDVDHFKAINDEHGHPAGDAVLRSLGKLLTAQTCASDAAGRAGGEEFWLVLGDTRAPEAAAFAEQLLSEVRGLRVTTGQRAISLTVSIGLAEVRSADENLEAVLHRLDLALYRAKAGGRDRLEMARQHDGSAVAPVDRADTQVNQRARAPSWTRAASPAQPLPFSAPETTV